MCRELLRADLHLDLGVGDEVEVPLGMLVGAALRRDHDVSIAVTAVDQRRPPELAGLSAARREQERLYSPPVMPLLPAALDIPADMLIDPARGLSEISSCVRHWLPRPVAHE